MRDREISSKARNTHTKACNTSKLFIFHRVSNAAVKQTETERAGTYSAHRRRHDYTFRFLSSPLALSTITANSSIAKARTTSSSSVRFGFWFFFWGKNLKNSPSSSATKTKGKQIQKTPESINTGVARELLVRLRRIQASGCSAALTKTTGRAQRRRRRTERQKERQKERKEVQYKKIKK